MIKNLFKATLSVALMPVTIVADTLMLPGDAQEPKTKPFPRTTAMINNVIECTVETIKKENECE